MGDGKKHRHDKDHEQRADRPQSTDIADVIEMKEGDAARDASTHQRRQPTAGPSEDDRFGEGPVAVDQPGRILGVSIEDGRTRIMIGLGPKQGVHVGMEGYIQAGDGMLADFQIDQVKERTCYAFVDTTPDGLNGHHQVMINPTSRPKSSEPRQDVHTRILGISVEGERIKLLIGLGVRHGARTGMRGYLEGGPGGRPYAMFEIEEARSGTSVAYLEHETVDSVRAHTNVVVNPKQMPGEAKVPSRAP